MVATSNSQSYLLEPTHVVHSIYREPGVGAGTSKSNGDHPHDTDGGHVHSTDSGHVHSPNSGHAHSPDDGHVHSPDGGHVHGIDSGHTHDASNNTTNPIMTAPMTGARTGILAPMAIPCSTA